MIICYHNILKAEADVRIHLSSIKPYIEKICILSLNLKNMYFLIKNFFQILFII